MELSMKMMSVKMKPMFVNENETDLSMKMKHIFVSENKTDLSMKTIA